MLTPFQALLLGAIEGLTEYLPVSSTGHLILVSTWLGLQGEGIKAFDVVIQSGAILAVLGLYRARVAAMGRGVLGQDPAGRRLLVNVLLGFVPAAAAGLALHHFITARLFAPGPVVAALALGGLVMVATDGWLRARSAASGRAIEDLQPAEALMIGLAQCLSLWPGTSRALVTIVAGILVGLPATAAAEFSFLLALPTLGAATLLDTVWGGTVLAQQSGPAALACGFAAAALVAALVVRGFVRYLARGGFSGFGWYRMGVAALIWWTWRG